MRWIVLLISMFALSGCDYGVPLEAEPNLERQEALIGVWLRTREDGQLERLVILPLEAKQYLVTFSPVDGDTLYGRAWRCQVSDYDLMQLRWIGTNQGEQPENDRIYQIARYQLADDQLTVNLLNPAIVSRRADSPAELREAIETNADKADLFRESMRFTRQKAE